LQYRFDEKVDLEVQKSLRSALRLFKDRLRESQAEGAPQRAPSYEEFLHVVQDIIEGYKKKDLSRLRTPLMREIYEKAWIQKLRNYAMQRQLRDAFEGLARRF
jgi:hypothetical protein